MLTANPKRSGLRLRHMKIKVSPKTDRDTEVWAAIHDTMTIHGWAEYTMDSMLSHPERVTLTCIRYITERHPAQLAARAA